MATVSPVVLKCAVCSFESEIFADFQSHRCESKADAPSANSFDSTKIIGKHGEGKADAPSANSIDSTKIIGEGKADAPSASRNHNSVWSKAATGYVIELHTFHAEKFTKPSFKKKEVWRSISDEMNKKGFPFTFSQCEQKWKNLTKAYRDCVDHNSKSGNDRKECPFYKELEECYGYRPNVKPLFTLGTRKEDDTESTDTEESAAGSVSNDCDVAPKRKKKNKPSEIVVILDDMRKEHREMMKTIKDQHEKRMENEQRKIEIMSQLVEAMKSQ